MKTTFKIIGMTFLVAMLATGGTFGQQLPQFSQYIFNGLHINPGYAGYKGEPYIQSTYRSQWVNFPGAPKTFTVTADLAANEGTMGFGISLLSDQLGPTSTTGGLLTYAYRIQTGRNSFLGLGASVGLTQYSIDGDMLDPNDPNDPEIPQGMVNLFTPNMNSGLFFHSSKFYAGFSAYNMIGKKALEKEDVALAYHDFHYYLTAGAMFTLGEHVGFKPSFLIKEVKGAPTNYDINAMFLFYDRIWLGGSYRSNMKIWNDNLEPNLSNRNAVAAIIEIFATDRLRIGYAYDHNLNVLQDYRANSHEFSLGYYMTPRKATMKNQRWF
ncbi:type IX secretion system PorP/SprF family membrane protein [Algoriphagus boseongensis]|uniref:Type IX secretion system PorP/SprF family membrane protein n=1 Tax=Algoriphagus boseongensis TaxID=1442587 RepID=A0A4R6T8V4_9BACT|nr:type IX secretion system membrane protein PorP/SprF [Algoriphagus boseongensis]TDQ20354.1 type IX secretion system PorP/SprF family membrane protein [Algoriphagus boseongensis]